jgi:hypothetical protein
MRGGRHNARGGTRQQGAYLRRRIVEEHQHAAFRQE